MSNLQSQIKKYPLLPFSQLVYDMTRWWPKVFTIYNIYMLLHNVSLESVSYAIQAAIKNHPVFSTRIDREGKQYAVNVQDVFHGPYHTIKVQKQGESVSLQVGMSRILGDDRSLQILLEDAINVYQGKALKEDNYLEYLEYIEQKKQSQHYVNSKVWLINEFADDTIPIHPTTDRRLWTLFPPKGGLFKVDYADLRFQINQFAQTKFLSIDSFFSLSAALAIAEYCGTDAAALTWAYEGRERPEEQRIFGSLHRDIPFQINRKSKIENQKSDLIRQARNQIRSGIAHSDYPYTLTKPYSERWNYAVNVLRVSDWPSLLQHIPIPIEFSVKPTQKYAYALLDIEIHESFDGLALWYRYSATHYKESSIIKFAALVRKYAEWLLEE